MLKIAIVGKRATTRTQVAQILKRQYGFKLMRMSDPTQRTMRMFYKGRGHQMWERRMLLYDALYETDNDIHINYAISRAEMSTNDLVIDDVRYINELEKLRENGFIIIRVESMGPKKPGKALTRKSSAGSLVLHEYFLDTKNTSYNVDYSMVATDLVSTKASIAQLLLDIRAKYSV